MEHYSVSLDIMLQLMHVKWTEPNHLTANFVTINLDIIVLTRPTYAGLLKNRVPVLYASHSSSTCKSLHPYLFKYTNNSDNNNYFFHVGVNPIPG
jgi:hypothetical protein